MTAVQARIAALEAACTPLADRLPAYPLLRSIPGVGPTVAAILLAEIGDIGWYTPVLPAPEARGARQSSGCSRGSPLARPGSRRAGGGSCAGPSTTRRWGVPRTAAGAARLAALKAKRRGDRYAGFKAIVELAAKQLRLVWGVWRSGDPRMTRPGPGGCAARAAERAGGY